MNPKKLISDMLNSVPPAPPISSTHVPIYTEKETLAALKKSIAHWRRLSAGKAKEGEGVGVGHCALCNLFYLGDCKGCPVHKKTGKMDCLGTPYYDAHDNWLEFNSNSPEFRKAAKDELKFLESLLPPKPRKKRKSVS